EWAIGKLRMESHAHKSANPFVIYVIKREQQLLLAGREIHSRYTSFALGNPQPSVAFISNIPGYFQMIELGEGRDLRAGSIVAGIVAEQNIEGRIGRFFV